MKKENFIIYVSNIVILCFFLAVISYLIFGVHWYSLLFVFSPTTLFCLWFKIRKNRLMFMLSVVAMVTLYVFGIALFIDHLNPWYVSWYLFIAGVCVASNMGLSSAYPKPFLIRTFFTTVTQALLMLSLVFIVSGYMIIGTFLSLSIILISKEVSELIQAIESREDVYMWSVL